MIATTILALVIALKVWHLLTAISVITFFIAYYLDEQNGGSYISIPGFSIMWIFFNLIMWLVYFIIV